MKTTKGVNQRRITRCLSFCSIAENFWLLATWIKIVSGVNVVETVGVPIDVMRILMMAMIFYGYFTM